MRICKRLFVMVLFAIMCSASYAQEFISPIGFVDNDANRQKVIAYIKKVVSQEPSLKEAKQLELYIYQKQQLDAFKELIKVKNTKLLQEMIKSFCGMGMCNYMIIMEAYRASDHNYHPPLEW